MQSYSAERSAQSRLEQARYQYENLLLNAGSSKILDTPSKSPSYQSRSVEKSANFGKVNITQDQSGIYDDINDGAHQNKSFDAEYNQSSSAWVGQGCNDKDDVIIMLQEENERLKQQMEQMMTSTEQLLQEAERTNHELTSSYESKIRQLQRENSQLQESYEELSVLSARVNQELQVERQQLFRSLQILDRQQRRSGDYLEVQRKASVINKHMDGLHYLSYLEHDGLQELRHHLEGDQQQHFSKSKRRDD
jgi:vacuolar-type H+-ATPase subunit H